MRYVTITNSRFYNNAAGIVPNALDSEKFPPAEDNIIRDNEIFWNNFNFHQGAPFKIREDGHRRARARSAPACCCSAAAATRSRTTRSSATGTPAWPRSRASCCEENPEAGALVGNIVRNNAFGLNGTDLNGRELAYDGNGSETASAATPACAVTIPADGSTLAPCPFAGTNAFNRRASSEMLTLAGEDGVASWIRAPARAEEGLHAAGGCTRSDASPHRRRRRRRRRAPRARRRRWPPPPSRRSSRSPTTTSCPTS